jgi:hypothetical protein
MVLTFGLRLPKYTWESSITPTKDGVCGAREEGILLRVDFDGMMEEMRMIRLF